MGLGISLKFVAQIFHVLAGPLFSLVYPLYASIKAIESNSNADTQQWLTYWVLFIPLTLLEYLLADILECFPFWPYIKVMVTCLLVVPYFGCTTYVYEHFVRPRFSVKPHTLNDSFTSIEIYSKQDDFLVVAERHISKNGLEAVETLIIGKDECREPRLSSADWEVPCLTALKKPQKEWACALCLVICPSERCLKSHIRGKKHYAKKSELKANKKTTGKQSEFVSNLKRSIGVDQVEDLKPEVRPTRWCRWKKPERGWTKLNTDGSIHPGNVGLGGLLRDYTGNPICAFISKPPRVEIFSLELWAIWRGLVLASGQGIAAIWVESDALSVVKTINKESPGPQEAGNCLRCIWVLLEKFEKYEVTHSWREANRAADHLAKMEINESDDVVLWPVEFPEALNNIIKEDAEGKTYPRV